MIIYVGDSQISEKEPLKQGVVTFWDWLYSTYPDATIIHGGDFFEKSNHHHSLVDQMLGIILKFKDIHIVVGNHDKSQTFGCILETFKRHPNIKVYDDLTFFKVEGINFIALPYKGSKNKEYENIKNESLIEEVDYSVCHFEPIQESFNKQTGVELKFNPKIAHIFSHIHRHREFIDNYGNKVLIAGGVVPIKNGEQDWEKNVYVLEKKGYSKIKVPQIFTYETIEYGSFPANKNNILNVIKAPSVPSVHSMYKDYYIREEGIELLIDETQYEGDSVFEFNAEDNKKSFVEYGKEKGVRKEIVEKGLEYLI